ncbi:MAG: hypothetical protein HYU44_18960 [Betaproteobacteria bacterium]|nr:hypothetical protein [Betaproteobacteria bacterium]MBI2293210.1 hypothetical protein [Betaproteobacteria bacterium]MBI3054061.1 hypothetical protein [Betaproteobacteria bacterium]
MFRKQPVQLRKSYTAPIYSLVTYVGTLAINPSLYQKLPYDPIRDFAPVTVIATLPLILELPESRERLFAMDPVLDLLRPGTA